VLLEGSTESITLESKNGDTVVIRCGREGTKVFGGCVVDKEYCSRLTMAARNWMDRLRRWLRI
jgi:hypothetical protein